MAKLAWRLHLSWVAQARAAPNAVSHSEGVLAMLLSMLAAHIALYVGPDTLLPLTSILGAIGGAVMIFWRQLTGFFKRVFRRSAE